MLSMNKLILRIFYAEKKSWNKVREKENFKIFRTRSLFSYSYSVDPFCSEFYQKATRF